MLTEQQFEDILCGDLVKCMYHQEVMRSPLLIEGIYGERLTCGCPFKRLVIIKKHEGN